MFDPRERIDRIYCELGVPPEKEDALERWERMRPKPEPKRPERQLDIGPPTMAEIDQLIGQRIADEHERMTAIIAEVIAIAEEWTPAAPPGPPGPPGPAGTSGAPGKLPVVKLWTPESVFYEGDVVTFDGGTFQATRDTGRPPTHAAHWICLAVGGRNAKSPRVRGTFSADAQYRELDIVA